MGNKYVNVYSSAIIRLTQYNSLDGSERENSTINCTETEHVKCRITWEYPQNIHIMKVILKIPKFSGDKTGFYLADLEGSLILEPGYFYEAGIIEYENYNTDDYLLIDITDKMLNHYTGPKVFLIKQSDTQSTFSCSNNAEIIIEGITDNYYIKDKAMIVKEVGNVTSYSIDPIFRTFTLSTNLMNLGLGELPINLSILYNHYHGNYSFAPFFRFNYEQILIAEGNSYLYYDGGFNKHYFKQSNNSNIYYDITNPGLVLYIETNGFMITNGHMARLYFDSFGKLIRIEKQLSDDLIKQCHIEYVNNKISKVIDDLGRVCNFTYNYNADNSIDNIIVSVNAVNEITLNFENGLLVSIQNIINNSTMNNNISYEYISKDFGFVVKKIREINNEVLEIFYDQVYLLAGISNYVERNGNVGFLYKKEIESSYKKATIINIDEDNIITSKNVIEYDENGSIVCTYDEIDGVVSNKKEINKTEFFHRYSPVMFEKIYKIPKISDVGILESFSFVTTTGIALQKKSNEIVINTNDDKEEQKYVIRLKIGVNLVTDFTNITKNSKNHIKIQFCCKANNTVELLEEYVHTITETFYHEKSYMVKLPKHENLILYYIMYIDDCNIFIGMSDVTIEKAIIFGEKYRVNNIDNINSDNINYNSFIDIENLSKITYSSNNVINEVTMNNHDFLITLENFYFNKNNLSEYNLWYNCGRNFLSNITDVVFFFGEIQIPIHKLVFCNIDDSVFHRLISRYDFYSNQVEIRKILTRFTYGFSYQSIVEEINSKYGDYSSVFDSNYIINISEIDYTTTGKNEYYEIFNREYDNVMINSEKSIEYNDDSVQYTEYSYPYPQTILDEPNVVSSVINKQSGNIQKRILANNQEIEYTYKQDNFSANDISTIVDSIVNKNTLLYTNNKLTGLSHNDSVIQFNYGNKNEITSVNIGSNNLLTISNSYSNKQTTVNKVYNTGDNETCVYDLQGRLVQYSTVLMDGYNIYSNINTKEFIENNYPSDNHADSLLRKSNDGLTTSIFYYDKEDYNNEDVQTIEESEEGTTEEDDKNKDNPLKQITKIVNTNYTKTFSYDDISRLYKIKTVTPDFLHQLNITYSFGDAVNKDYITNLCITYNNSIINKNYERDYLNRLNEIKYTTGNNSYKKTISYFSNGSNTSNYIHNIDYSKIISENQSNDVITSFENETILYDSLGNITEIKYSDNSKINYIYDAIGRLIRENNQVLNKTYVYLYDGNGNIISKKEYDYSTTTLSENPTSVITYSYDLIYKDKLTNVTINNTPYNITYGDTSCTLLPLNFKNQSFTWYENNRLRTYQKSSTHRPITFTYNAKGQRVMYTQVIDVNVHENREYIYEGDKLITEIRRITPIKIKDIVPPYYEFPIIDKIHYIYDDNGIIGIDYKGTVYYYIKDVLGNIKYLTDTSYNIVAKYEYDAWGNHVVYKKTTSGYTVNQDAGFIGNINPFRYKGYYYDVETQLFYCNSRYYSPELCRFISPDSIEYLDPQSINGLNLYCYCMNNPIMYADPSGYFPFFLLTALLAVGITAAVDYIPDQEFDLHWGWYVGAAVLGAAVGLGISYYATGSAFSSVGKVFSGLFGKTTFYRSMSADDYATLQANSKLPAGTETFISPSSSYASTYNGVTVKFTVRNRTVNWLTKIGVKDGSTLVGSMYPSMPMVSKGWMATNAFFKAEQGIINIGLGYGRALDIFNKGIVMFGLL